MPLRNLRGENQHITLFQHRTDILKLTEEYRVDSGDSCFLNHFLQTCSATDDAEDERIAGAERAERVDQNPNTLFLLDASTEADNKRSPFQGNELLKISGVPHKVLCTDKVGAVPDDDDAGCQAWLLSHNEFPDIVAHRNDTFADKLRQSSVEIRTGVNSLDESRIPPGWNEAALISAIEMMRVNDMGPKRTDYTLQLRDPPHETVNGSAPVCNPVQNKVRNSLRCQQCACGSFAEANSDRVIVLPLFSRKQEDLTRATVGVSKTINQMENLQCETSILLMVTMCRRQARTFVHRRDNVRPREHLQRAASSLRNQRVDLLLSISSERYKAAYWSTM